ILGGSLKFNQLADRRATFRMPLAPDVGYTGSNARGAYDPVFPGTVSHDVGGRRTCRRAARSRGPTVRGGQFGNPEPPASRFAAPGPPGLQRPRVPWFVSRAGRLSDVAVRLRFSSGPRGLDVGRPAAHRSQITQGQSCTLETDASGSPQGRQ